MPMNKHDQSNYWKRGYVGALERVEQLEAEVKRLRAALAARPQPDEPTALDMVTDLHRAIYGDTWAQPESPRQVWNMLLGKVRGLASGWCGECERRAAREAEPGSSALISAYAVIRQLTEGGPETDPDWDPADYGWTPSEAAAIKAAMAGSATPTGDNDGR